MLTQNVDNPASKQELVSINGYRGLDQDTLQDAKQYYLRGNDLYRQQKFDQALESYTKATAVYQKMDNSEQSVDYAKTLNNIGLVYKAQRKPQEALEHYNMALSIYKRQPNNKEPIYQSRVLNNMGEVYYSRSRFQEAIDYYKRAAEIFEKQKNDNADYADALNNIGLVYKAQGKYS